jgi:methionyl-tRNA synthetase
MVHPQIGILDLPALYIVLGLSALLKPLIPETQKKLATMMGIDFEQWPVSLEDLVPKIQISNPEPLFKKIEADPEKENFNEKYK